MLATLLQEKPKIVSFHFGIPAPERIRALRDAGIIRLATDTNPPERKPSPMPALTRWWLKATRRAATEGYECVR